MDTAARVLVAVLLIAGLSACGGGDGSQSVAVVDSAPFAGDPVLGEGTDGDTTGEANEPPSAAADATPRQGRPPLSVAFRAANSSDIDGSILAYRWDFGDGATAQVPNPTHIYTTLGEFTARLTVTDNDGAAGSAAVLISVQSADPNQPPTAVFSAEPSTGAAPLAVSFDAGSSTDNDGAITGYRWSFGDGAGAVGPLVGHTYLAAGSYTAQLIVTDDDGAQASSSRLLTVTDPAATTGGAGSATSFAATGRSATADPPVAGAVGAGGRQEIRLDLRAGQAVSVAVDDHAAAEPRRNDLDVYLFDLSEPERPRYVSSSVGTGAAEIVRAGAAGRYALLIENSAGSSSYRVSFDGPDGPAPPRLEDAFVAGQLILRVADGRLPPLDGVRILDGLPGQPMLLALTTDAASAADRFWRQPGAPLQRYSTVRAAKRLNREAGVESAETNKIRRPQPRAMSRLAAGGPRTLAWPQGVAAPDETGALSSYELIQWLRAAAGLSAGAAMGTGVDLIELRLPGPGAAELATIEAVTATGAVVVTTP